MTARQAPSAKDTSRHTSASYPVGYGKPPRHTQFRKGRSGNPGGRPRRPAESANDLLLREAHRPVTVKISGRTVTLPALQAAVRSQLELAANGNVPAQRAVLAAVKAAERERVEEVEESDEAAEAAEEAAREMRREAVAQAKRELRAEVKAEMEAEVSAQAVRDVEAALQAAGGPAGDKRPEEMTYAEAAAQVRFLLGLDKRSDEAKAGPAGEGKAAARDLAARDLAAGESAQRKAAPVPERQTAPATPPVPSADPPAAPQSRWREPPQQPDRYARSPAREAFPAAPSRDVRFTSAQIPC